MIIKPKMRSKDFLLIIVLLYASNIILCDRFDYKSVENEANIYKKRMKFFGGSSLISKSRSTNFNIEDFLITAYLSSNKLKRWIHWNEKIATENLVKFDEIDETNRIYKNISNWQLTDGNLLIQAIYIDGQLKYCDNLRDRNEINKFSKKFTNDYYLIEQNDRFALEPLNQLQNNLYNKYSNYDFAESTRNVTYRKLNNIYDIPAHLQNLFNIHHLKKNCSHLLKSSIENNLKYPLFARSHKESNEISRGKRDISDWLIAPNTKWCGTGTQAGKYTELGGASNTDKCCRKHDYCRLTIPGLKTKWGLFNVLPYTLSQCKCDMRYDKSYSRKFSYQERRPKRDMNKLFIFPDTKWCGKGWTASSYTEIGGYSKADRCCRQHDKFCPYWIEGLNIKYQLFNWRINTIMHCKCDDRFRTCLKMADSSDANVVGKLFFNVVQTKCFVLRKEKVCTLKSWWGKCMKYGYKKRAYLRDNRKF